jgi:hypothetical protein
MEQSKNVIWNAGVPILVFGNVIASADGYIGRFDDEAISWSK